MRQDAEVKAKILRTMKRRGRGALDTSARSLGVERTRWGGGTQDAASEARYAEENKMIVEVTALRRRVQAMRLAQRALRERKRVALEADVAHEERTRVEERQSLQSLERRITATLRQKKASAQRCARLGAKLAQKNGVQRRKQDAVARHKEEARRGVGATESAMARKMIPLKRRLEDLDEELQVCVCAICARARNNVAAGRGRPVYRVVTLPTMPLPASVRLTHPRLPTLLHPPSSSVPPPPPPPVHGTRRASASSSHGASSNSSSLRRSSSP